MAPAVNDIDDHAIYLIQKNHLKEVGFYNHLAAQTTIAPRVYRAVADARSGHFCVLMAYYGEHAAYNEPGGCPVHLAYPYVEALARFHAANWGSRQGRPGFLDPPPRSAVDWMARRIGCSDAASRKILGKAFSVSWRHDLAARQTVLHGDPRVGNVLFGTAPHHQPIVLYDWQACRSGRGAFDLAYFIVLSMRTDDRRQHWDRLLDHYHAALVAAGVRDYERSELLMDAANASLLTVFFLAAPMLSREASLTDENLARLDDFIAAWGSRLLAALDDMDHERLAAHLGLDQGAWRAAVAALAADHAHLRA